MSFASTLFRFLIDKGFCKEDFEWFEGKLTDFELVISVILTQNTNWNNVKLALNNLKKAQIEDLESLISCPNLEELVRPSGFYKVKAKRLKSFSEAILRDFSSLDNFQNNLSRDWLLEQKGIGKESADSLLNYFAEQEVMVVDSYSAKLASHFGYEFESYDELASFYKEGIDEKGFKELLSGKNLSQIYQIFHAAIVDFSKALKKRPELLDELRKELE